MWFLFNPTNRPLKIIKDWLSACIQARFPHILYNISSQPSAKGVFPSEKQKTGAATHKGEGVRFKDCVYKFYFLCGHHPLSVIDNRLIDGDPKGLYVYTGEKDEQKVSKTMSHPRDKEILWKINTAGGGSAQLVCSRFLINKCAQGWLHRRTHHHPFIIPDLTH